MNNYIKLIKIFTGVIISIILSIFLWDFSSISYSNPGNVIGYYSEQNLSPMNNLLRFIIFTSIPICTYIVLHRIVYKDHFANFFLIFGNNYLDSKKKYHLNFFFIFLFFIKFFKFFIN